MKILSKLKFPAPAGWQTTKTAEATQFGSMDTAIPLLTVHRVDIKEGYPVFNTFTVSREFYVPSHLLSVIRLCYIHLNHSDSLRGLNIKLMERWKYIIKQEPEQNVQLLSILKSREHF